MIRWIVLSMIVLPGTGCLGPSLERFENSLVYQPVHTNIGPSWSGDFLLPKGGEFEEVRFNGNRCPINNGPDISLHGLFAEAKNPRAIVLYCHDKAGNVEICYETLRLFRDKLKVSVLVFDYRSYGKSDEGPLYEEGFIDDARMARYWLSYRTGVEVEDIILYGHSLGGAVAVGLACDHHGRDTPRGVISDMPRGLILDGTFTSIPDVADSYAYGLPLHWLMESKYDSLNKIKDYHYPLLQLHGNADSVVPYKLGSKLFDAANEPKQFVTIHGGNHSDPLAPEAIAALDKFFDQLNAAAADASAKRR